MTEMAAAFRADDLRPTPVRIGNPLDGPRDLVIEARPAASGVELVRRAVQRRATLFATVSSFSFKTVVFAGERRFGSLCRRSRASPRESVLFFIVCPFDWVHDSISTVCTIKIHFIIPAKNIASFLQERIRMQPCCAAARQNVPDSARSDFPAGTTFPRQDYPSAGESRRSRALRAQALTAGSVSGRRRSGTDETGNRVAEPGLDPQQLPVRKKPDDDRAERRKPPPMRPRQGATVNYKKKGRERPDIPFLSASRAFIRKVSLRPSPSTVVCDRLRRRSPR